MTLFGLTITRKAAPAATLVPTIPGGARSGGGGWFGVIREAFTGAWQQNVEVQPVTALAHSAVFACTTLIASDLGKLALRLMAQDDSGIWTEASSPAFSPVLRKPNAYQTIIKFIEAWIVSKLVWGNTYILKERDQRGVVVALYVLDPQRVKVLVAADGSVFYELGRDPLSGLTAPGAIAVPAREIIHDLMVALYHPLCGVSPIHAAGLAAVQGLTMQQNSNTFFANGSRPGGVLSAPGPISDTTAQRLKEYWDSNFGGNNVGKIAVVGDGLKFEPMGMPASDAQLIEQLRWTAETVCSCYHVPAWMIGVGGMPPYANSEPLLQLYYSQCLQSLIANFELCLDEGLELPRPYGTELDITDLIWMDSKTKTDAAAAAVNSGTMSPDEARRRYFGLGPVPGGGSPYLQQQYYSLAALAARDAQASTPAPPPPTPDLTALALSADTLLRHALEIAA